MHEPIKRLPKLTSASKTSTLKPLLGIVVLAIAGALTTVGLRLRALSAAMVMAPLQAHAALTRTNKKAPAMLAF